jgi:hypothetical protein
VGFFIILFFIKDTKATEVALVILILLKLLKLTPPRAQILALQY